MRPDMPGIVAGVAATIAFFVSAYFFYAGGVYLPPGRYPIILLAALFLVPPALVAAVAAGVAAGITYGIMKGADSAGDRKAADARGRRWEEIEAAARMPDQVMGTRKVMDLMAEHKLTGWWDKDGEGRTALHYAASARNLPLVEALAAQERANYLPRDKAGRVFFEAAPPDTRDAVLEIFSKCHASQIDHAMREQGLVLVKDDLPAMAKALAAKIARSNDGKGDISLPRNLIDLNQLRWTDVNRSEADRMWHAISAAAGAADKGIGARDAMNLAAEHKLMASSDADSEGRTLLHIAAIGRNGPMLDALARYCPKVLRRDKAGRLFYEAAPVGQENNVLAIFANAYTRGAAEQMRTHGWTLAEDDFPAWEKMLTDWIVQKNDGKTDAAFEGLIGNPAAESLRWTQVPAEGGPPKT